MALLESWKAGPKERQKGEEDPPGGGRPLYHPHLAFLDLSRATTLPLALRRIRARGPAGVLGEALRDLRGKHTALLASLRRGAMGPFTAVRAQGGRSPRQAGPDRGDRSGTGGREFLRRGGLRWPRLPPLGAATKKGAARDRAAVKPRGHPTSADRRSCTMSRLGLVVPRKRWHGECGERYDPRWSSTARGRYCGFPTILGPAGKVHLDRPRGSTSTMSNAGPSWRPRSSIARRCGPRCTPPSTIPTPMLLGPFGLPAGVGTR